MIKGELTNFGYIHGIGSSYYGTIPIQAIPNNQKTVSWKKATVDAIERIGLRQLQSNIVFSSYRRMIEGRFTYEATDLDSRMEMPWFDENVRKLRTDQKLPTYIKHFDFIGIIVNVITGLYGELDDKYIVESIDEYSTNEWIRQKTEKMHQYAQQLFAQEVNAMLMSRGADPNKTDFKSQEEQQQYQQQIEEQVKALTPPEIEGFMSKNFKVVATEWAQNVLTADKKKFYLSQMDKEQLVDYLLTGRFFRHYYVGYDTYKIERWLPEETFFSEDAHAMFPQDGEFAGRTTSMSISDVLNRFGHLMTTTEQEAVGNYWNQTKKWNNPMGARENRISARQAMFPGLKATPFHNYYDHLANLEVEDAFGIPMGVSTDAEGNERNTWIPRQDEVDSGLYSNNFTSLLREDIEVRRDTIRVTELYWRSQKRIGVLIFRNDVGQLEVETVTDELMKEFIDERDIKIKRNLTLKELSDALKKETLEEYENTITYIYVPEIWKGVKIKGNGSTLKEDLYLDVQPLEYQIKGEGSNIYDVKLPITGITTSGMVTKLIPYQQLHNIAMNQITELIEKELGVFFTFDITALGDEYQDETSQDAILRVRENIKDTGLVGFDLSRQNTGNNQVNLFQRQEVVYATQVEYRWVLAQKYKQEAFSQIGITPEMIGQAAGYETAEGIKQGVRATHHSINKYVDEFNIAKAKSMEVQLAIAQYCEVEGTDTTIITRKGDSELAFIDILKEDGELFPLRSLSVMPQVDSQSRKVVEEIKQWLMSDNTMEKDMGDVIEILTNPVLVEIQQKAKEITAKRDKRLEEERQFKSQENDKMIKASQEAENLKHERMKEIEHIKGEYGLEEEQLKAYGRAALSDDPEANYDRIRKDTQEALKNEYKDKEVTLKETESQRKGEESKDKKRIELEKLALKAEEVNLRREKIQSDERISTINWRQ